MTSFLFSFYFLSFHYHYFFILFYSFKIFVFVCFSNSFCSLDSFGMFELMLSFHLRFFSIAGDLWPIRFRVWNVMMVNSIWVYDDLIPRWFFRIILGLFQILLGFLFCLSKNARSNNNNNKDTVWYFSFLYLYLKFLTAFILDLNELNWRYEIW